MRVRGSAGQSPRGRDLLTSKPLKVQNREDWHHRGSCGERVLPGCTSRSVVRKLNFGVLPVMVGVVSGTLVERFIRLDPASQLGTPTDGTAISEGSISVSGSRGSQPTIGDPLSWIHQIVWE